MRLTNRGAFYESCSWWKTRSGISRRKRWRRSEYLLALSYCFQLLLFSEYGTDWKTKWHFCEHFSLVFFFNTALVFNLVLYLFKQLKANALTFHFYIFSFFVTSVPDVNKSFYVWISVVLNFTECCLDVNLSCLVLIQFFVFWSLL